MLCFYGVMGCGECHQDSSRDLAECVCERATANFLKMSFYMIYFTCAKSRLKVVGTPKAIPIILKLCFSYKNTVIPAFVNVTLYYTL